MFSTQKESSSPWVLAVLTVVLPLPIVVFLLALVGGLGFLALAIAAFGRTSAPTMFWLGLLFSWARAAPRPNMRIKPSTINAFLIAILLLLDERVMNRVFLLTAFMLVKAESGTSGRVESCPPPRHEESQQHKSQR